MAKKATDLLKKKKALLDNFLDQAKKVNQVIPLVQEAKELTEWSLQTLNNAPKAALSAFDDLQLEKAFLTDLNIWQKGLPQLTFDIPYLTTSGSAASGTASAVVFDRINTFNQTAQPDLVLDWVKGRQDEYIHIQEQHSHVEKISEKIKNIFSGREVEFLEAEHLYLQAHAEVLTSKAGATAMRNVLEHFQGDLLNLARRFPGEQIKKSEQWRSISDRLATGGAGSLEHTLLMGKEIDQRDLFVRLTKVVKNLTTNPLPELRLIHARWIEHLFTTLNLLDPKCF